MKKTLAISTLLALWTVEIAALPVLAQPPAPVFDDARITAAGIHKLPGKRLTLYTDVTGPEIDLLPGAFEQAFPQWGAYFAADEKQYTDWHMTGILMKDRNRFAEAGLLPGSLPNFLHGYSAGSVLWLNEQPSDYYRRHLLLHEGTHSFMYSALGGLGPYWYMEGTAELLATHRWSEGRLTLSYLPQNRDEVPEWGRIRTIQDAAAKREALRLKTVIESPSTGMDDNASYAWRWAAVTLLDKHPRYQERFRQLRQEVAKADFNTEFYALFEIDWQPLCEEWQLMIANFEYGYDVARSAVDFTPGKPLPSAVADASARPVVVSVAADRGWQNTGLRLEANVAYDFTASGRYQIAKSANSRVSRDRKGVSPSSAPSKTPSDDTNTPAAGPGEFKTWWCEPGGVTMRYYRGWPLGILLAAVRRDEPKSESTSTLLRPAVIGLGATLTPKESGTLFLKVNDSAGELDDNAGELKVEIGQLAK